MPPKAKTRRKRTTATTKAASTPQIRRICNVVPSKDTAEDWKFEHAVASGALGVTAALPASVDLRKSWWTVGDQGGTGSCVGWASADGVMRYHMVKDNKLKTSELLSPRYVWMASKEMDKNKTRPESFVEEAGTSLKTAMDICRKYGVVSMGLLNFDIHTLMYTGDEKSFYAAAAQRRITSYFNLGKNFNQWKAWLAAHGPIMAGLSVDQAWDNASQTHGNIDVFQPNTVRGGHAVTVVGYTAAGRFIIRNSWGTGWGDKGFGYATTAYIAAGFFDEAYGVTL
jgi:C1A family cysteine protease